MHKKEIFYLLKIGIAQFYSFFLIAKVNWTAAAWSSSGTNK